MAKGPAKYIPDGSNVSRPDTTPPNWDWTGILKVVGAAKAAVAPERTQMLKMILPSLGIKRVHMKESPLPHEK